MDWAKEVTEYWKNEAVTRIRNYSRFLFNVPRPTGASEKLKKLKLIEERENAIYQEKVGKLRYKEIWQ